MPVLLSVGSSTPLVARGAASFVDGANVYQATLSLSKSPNIMHHSSDPTSQSCWALKRSELLLNERRAKASLFHCQVHGHLQWNHV